MIAPITNIDSFIPGAGSQRKMTWCQLHQLNTMLSAYLPRPLCLFLYLLVLFVFSVRFYPYVYLCMHNMHNLHCIWQLRQPGRCFLAGKRRPAHRWLAGWHCGTVVAPNHASRETRNTWLLSTTPKQTVGWARIVLPAWLLAACLYNCCLNSPG